MTRWARFNTEVPISLVDCGAATTTKPVSLPERGCVAVIGSGAAGLGAALSLSARHEVHVFEAGPRLGGHCNTVLFDDPGGPVPVDTGFIVFNPVNYPTLTRAFDFLRVASEPSDMSFSISIDGGGFEYSGNFPGGMLAQKRNLLRPRFWRMLLDVRRFYADAVDHLPDMESHGDTLGAWLARHGYSRAFRDDHLAPMAGAIWSQPQGEVLEMPAATLVRFFNAHGLLQVRDRPRWRTVSGGSRVYVAEIVRRLSGPVRTDTPVARLARTAEGVELTTAAGETLSFDAAVIATHADQALALLDAPSAAESDILGSFAYRANRAVLHRDPALMPRRRAAWASWNYVAPEGSAGPQGVTYWMNRLQNLTTAAPLFVTLNPPVEPDPARVVAEFDYTHPVFDSRAIVAQARLGALQGAGRLWFCGSYFGYGFHEDAFASGVRAAEAMGVPAPWTPGVRLNVSKAA